MILTAGTNETDAEVLRITSWNGGVGGVGAGGRFELTSGQDATLSGSVLLSTSTGAHRTVTFQTGVA
jgi:hypothetical protein